jgi:hypothetical protein
MNDSPTTEKIASRIRYWMVIEKDANNSTELRRTLGVSDQRARDLYKGRKAFTASELADVATWLSVPIEHILGDPAHWQHTLEPEPAPTSQRAKRRMRDRHRLTDQPTAQDDELIKRLDTTAFAIAALVWNPADNGFGSKFLDIALFDEILSIAPAIDEESGALQYCMRKALLRLANELNLVMPSRPEMDLPAAN